jgi:hypothetical protein
MSLESARASVYAGELASAWSAIRADPMSSFLQTRIELLVRPTRFYGDALRVALSGGYREGCGEDDRGGGEGKSGSASEDVLHDYEKGQRRD